MSEEKKDDLIDEEGKDANDQSTENKTGGSEAKETPIGTSKTEDKRDESKAFTQEQVNKLMAREKKQGKTAALKELGIDPSDTKMVAMMKAFIESQKTDEQKEVETQLAEAAKLAEANQRVLIAEAKAEAMQLGAKVQYVEDIVTLISAKMTDDADIRTLITELKTKYSTWFGAEDEDDKSKTGQRGTGSSINSNSGKGSKSDEGKGLGARLAAQRKANTKKTSFWG